MIVEKEATGQKEQRASCIRGESWERNDYDLHENLARL